MKNFAMRKKGQAAVEYFVVATAVFVAVMAIWAGIAKPQLGTGQQVRAAGGSGDPFNDYVSRINAPGVPSQ